MDDKCAAAETLIQEYLSGCLDGEGIRGLFGHIAVCGHCRRELAWQNRIKKSAAGALLHPPEELGAAIAGQAVKEKQDVQIIPEGLREALGALRSAKQTVDRSFIPVRSCLKLASKCI